MAAEVKQAKGGLKFVETVANQNQTTILSARRAKERIKYMEKKTLKEMFEQIKANYPLTAEEIEFIDGRIAKLATAKKAAGETTKHKALVADAAKAVDMLVEAGETVAAKDLATAMEVSSQKLTAIMKVAIEAGQAEKVMVKRVAHYKALV